ncbi:unnamed protein product [Clonostachys solani]|uniref:Uncharacterized protein n=1 Tax=Clonostachys solani TaxID=160281 RepID=A0A9N9YYQ1_9HYPO|nr:unnamed protein product [Clonostachys solani]
MSSEPSKAEGTSEPLDPSKVGATAEQDPLEDRPPGYSVDINPPNYEVNEICDRQPDATEEEWRLGSPLHGEAPCPEDWPTRPQANLVFCMTPLGFLSLVREWFKTVPERDWVAEIQINAKNIPGLMRDGFHWSSANIVPGRGSILLDMRDHLKEIGLGPTNCKHMRTYKLKGNENTDIEWRGTLTVYAMRSFTVTNFDLNWLTQDKIIFVTAFDWNSKPVYAYERYRASKNFNVVYEGMPLEGWWPWPKAAPPSQGNHSKQAVAENSAGES